MKLGIAQMQEIVTDILKNVVEICDRNKITYYCQAGTVLGTVRHGGPIPWDHDADLIIPNNEIDKFVECALRDLPEDYFVDYFTLDDTSLRQFPRVGKKGFSSNMLHVDIFRLIGIPDDRESQLELIEEARSYTRQNKLMLIPVWKLLAKGKLKYALGKLGIGKIRRTTFLHKFDELCNRYTYEKASFVMNPSGKYGEKNIFRKESYGEGVMMKYSGFDVRIPSDTENYLRQYYGDFMQYPPKEYIDAEMSRTFLIKEAKNVK